ncbi:hypothetical protein CONPUDRAFT_116167 [Coniophora puteana RWD-64-598 SS2]|uniref:Rsm22-domain-containing protein n=1 Tax=Coniophora puteana (strain RWD-64-598) TaxID=741705 RepID=A0A5M3N6P1_CONPW|nr:uncharacterized protein CONPUDRAFT_116167 [Coniophora puteana RWD-64-598 SS2]EIW87110.1 hypothetical protein CONPUDRAFT_116167 [Coniophora puteana RWD-64-598 SS2]
MLRRAGTFARSAIASTSVSQRAAPYSTALPKPPLDVDPALQALLRDVDISLHSQKRHDAPARAGPRELEAFGLADAAEREVIDEGDEEAYERREERKSPAAAFGGHRVGAVVLPAELSDAVTALIEDSDKVLLHSDAERLFRNPEFRGVAGEAGWSQGYDVEYRNRRQAYQHQDRDGTAFASVVLPAHYAATYAVLHQAQHRIGHGWDIKRVIDWGAATGSGLWASCNIFQHPPETEDAVPRLGTSYITSYTGIDKRDGLTKIAKHLLSGLDIGRRDISWSKSYHEDRHSVPREEGSNTLALSAFNLSSLNPPLARKTQVKEMWQSGAGTIILIDHSTPEGFQAIAEARQYLLDLGAREVANPDSEVAGAAGIQPILGSHVVAPCPHDGACPLLPSSKTGKLVCGFEQRLQRPSFTRLTKHAKAGHEDIGYSYVVVRRGPRPSLAAPTTSTKVATSSGVGRVGAVGREVLQQQREKTVQELSMFDEDVVADPASTEAETNSSAETSESTNAVAGDSINGLKGKDLETALRYEALSWPRLVFPPLKKSGHILLDACTPEAKIMRLTIPRSQGKQEYYDARKAQWGDSFPHKPKNAPQERNLPEPKAPAKTPSKGKGKGKNGVPDIGSAWATMDVRPGARGGAHIGKRKERQRSEMEVGYEEMSERLSTQNRDTKKFSRRDRAKLELDDGFD